MEWSSAKRLSNEMLALENINSNYVSHDKFYMIKISYTQDIPDLIDVMLLAQELLWTEPQPCCVYVSTYGIILIFPCLLEGEEHNMNGKHNSLISKYAIKMYQIVTENTESQPYYLDECINIKIVECITQTQVVAYIAWIMLSTAQRTMQLLSNGKITDNLLSFKTNTELTDILEKECNIEWNKISNNDKYGSLLRVNKENMKTPYEEMSGPIDAREMYKYNKFIFE